MGAYQRYSKLGPREFRKVVQIGFTACVLCFICLSGATVYAQQDASSAPGYQPTSLSVSPFTRWDAYAGVPTGL